MSDGQRTVPLMDGKYERHEDLQSEFVTVKHVFCFGHGVSEHALLTTDWMGCGAELH